MRSAIISGLLLGLSTACTSGASTSDRNLGGLVEAAAETPRPIDMARLTAPDELLRAIMQPHAIAGGALGAHVTSIKSTTTVTEGKAPVEVLTVDTTLELAKDGSFHAVTNNSADYGDETTFLDGDLFLRPRYARWHHRAPNDAAEPLALRDRSVSELGAALDLLLPAVAITDAGAVTVQGRPARKLVLAQAASPRPPTTEPLLQRAWRSSRTVAGVVGEVVLDAVSGVPLTATLAGTVTFVRDGRTFAMALDVSHQVSGIGSAVTIVPPPPDQTVETPGRTGEVDDRDELLRGIAPPTKQPGPADPVITPPPVDGAGSGTSK